jgi:GNAT superfamily N-acetyltransferase
LKIVPGAIEGRLEGIWPQFLLHDPIANTYWDRLYTDFADFQFRLVEDGELLAEGNCVPVRGMPAQWRDVFLNAWEGDGDCDRVSALAIMVSPEHRGRGISRVMLEHMRRLAAPVGELVAPVRPTLKERYPLITVERYVEWRRDDGAHFDPWIRTHERVGGRVTGTAQDSMVIEAPVTEWADWTGLAFPSDGDYVVPGALVPVSVRDGHGTYREPCVWIVHPRSI